MAVGAGALVKRAPLERVELAPEQFYHLSGGPICDSSSPDRTLDAPFPPGGLREDCASSIKPGCTD
jgi:hypothetical protein